MFGNGRRLNFGALVVTANAPPAPSQAPPATPPTSPAKRTMPSFWETFFPGHKQPEHTLSNPELEWRLAECGVWYHDIDPNDGKVKPWEFRCGCWRDGCEACLETRVEEFKERGKNALAACDGKMVIVQGNKLEISVNVREMNKDGNLYWRVPGKDSDLFFFDGRDYGIESDLELDDIDWLEAARTPSRRRVSGDLGKEEDEPEEDKGPHITVETPRLALEPGEGHTLSEAWDEAVKETADLHPEYDKEQIEAAVKKRMKAYKEAVERGGGYLRTEMTRRAKVWINLYRDWKGPIRIVYDTKVIEYPGVPF